MLREFDEKDAPRRRPVALSGEFWLGVFAVIVGCSLMAGWLWFWAQ